MDLKTPLSTLTGVGPSLLYKLDKLGLKTIEDLIYNFPFRYDDFSNNTSVIEAKIGEVVTLQGEIWSIKNIFTRSRKVITQAVFNDGTSPIDLTWFNQSYLTKQIKTGDRLQVSGKLTKYKNKLSIMVPRWEKIENSIETSNISHQTLHTGRLIPIYSETEGLSSKWLRTKIDKFLPIAIDQIDDSLPSSITGNMLSLKEALTKIHYPQSWEDVKKSRERIGFDELFFVSLATQKTRLEWNKKPLIKALKIDEKKLKTFIKKLPFELTSAQNKVIGEMIQDLKKQQPMNRLIQGEVGSGKTVVVAIIAYLIHLNKLKTLFMAPTEILAFQHYETLKKLLEPFGIKIGIYTGSKKSEQVTGYSKHKKEAVPYNLKPVTSNIIIGTHALLSEKLLTSNVGLVVIDEQQRFGVEQRTLLRSRGEVPHFLTTTATPIPRTVALTLYGDLDLSVINELPKERLKIKTHVVPSKKRSDAYAFIAKKIQEGDQAYIITPLIEESETLQTVKAATAEFEKLKKEIFPNLKLGLLHGRLRPKEKDQVMQDFKEKRIDILVSTSVVEVGVDVPNATIMMIESAEKFGLSQLHQLRGRVGRGKKQSFCLLFSESEESQISRLKHLETISDGMKLSELDLKIRGAGQIFGKEQSGRMEFKIASFSDLALVEKTRDAAAKVLQEDPQLDKYPSLKAKLQNLAREVMPD